MVHPAKFFLSPAVAEFWLQPAVSCRCLCQRVFRRYIGGWVHLPGQPVLWFSEMFEVEHFRSLGIQVRDSAQSDIVAYELLAQIVLVFCLATTCREGRLPLCVPCLSDNSGAEAMVHKMFTVQQPLCFFVQKLATGSWQSGITLDTSHVCGAKKNRS